MDFGERVSGVGSDETNQLHKLFLFVLIFVLVLEFFLVTRTRRIADYSNPGITA